MPVPDFSINWIRDQVATFRNEFVSLTTDDQAFAAWALGYIHELEPDEAVSNSKTLIGGGWGGDLGCDGYVIPSNADNAFLTQAKYTDHDPNYETFSATQLSSVSNWFEALLDPELSAGLPDGTREVSNRMIDAQTGQATFVFQFFLFGRITENQEAALRASLEAHGTEENKVEIDIWDISRFHKEYIARETEDNLAGQTLNITLLTESQVSYEPPEPVPGISRASIVTLDAHSLAGVSADHDPEIFNANVRYHLGSNRVNSAIRESLASTGGQAAFWVRNNGITVVAESYDITDGAVTLGSPQIVNGCQTTKALILERASLEPGACGVVARLIELGGTEDQKRDALVNISETTNSQNPVSPEDLKANHPVQRELEASFKTIGWLYERKKKQFESLSQDERARFRTCRVSKERIGQSWRAFSGEPSASIKQKGQLFKDMSIYGEVFDPHRDPHEYLLAEKLFSFWETFLKRDSVQIRDILAPDRFDNDDGASSQPDPMETIERARRQWVAHCTALSATLIEDIDDLGEPAQVVSLLDNQPEDSPLNRPFRLVIATYFYWIGSKGQNPNLKGLLERADEESLTEWKQDLSLVQGI